MYNETIKYLKTYNIEHPEIGLILGSGLGDFVEEIENKIVIPYEKIPNFPVSTIEGHAGQLVYGIISGRKVIALQGRFHYYEGHSMDAVTYPIRIFKELGVNQLIVTNAAGGVNSSFTPGDFMLITDHINLAGTNPLIGPNVDSHGPRFVDMSEAYSLRTQEIVVDIAKENKVSLKKGIYAWMSGPTYETPAEVRMIHTLGGDAVGMSTVPEVIVARHAGIEVTGISCITNMAAGLQASLNHEEVVEVSRRVKSTFKVILRQLIERV